MNLHENQRGWIIFKPQHFFWLKLPHFLGLIFMDHTTWSSVSGHQTNLSFLIISKSYLGVLGISKLGTHKTEIVGYVTVEDNVFYHLALRHTVPSLLNVLAANGSLPTSSLRIALDEKEPFLNLHVPSLCVTHILYCWLYGQILPWFRQLWITSQLHSYPCTSLDHALHLL